MAEIIWSPKASTDFQNIQDYLEAKLGEGSKRKFTKRTFNFLELLSRYPHLGSMEFPEKNIRGFVLSKQTTLLYKAEGGYIFILAFFDNRKDSTSKKQ